VGVTLHKGKKVFAYDRNTGLIHKIGKRHVKNVLVNGVPGLELINPKEKILIVQATNRKWAAALFLTMIKREKTK